jgi:hypothetical protein
VARKYGGEIWQKHENIGKVILTAGRHNMNMPACGRNWSDGLCCCNTKSKSSSSISKWMMVECGKCGMGHKKLMKRKSKFRIMCIIC